MAKILDQAHSKILFAAWQRTYEVSLAVNIRIYAEEQEKYKQSCTDNEKDLCIEMLEIVQECCLGVDKQVC